jgi:hypothetical protein
MLHYLFDGVLIVVTSIATTIFSHIFGKKRLANERKMANSTQLLDKVYEPIYKIIRENYFDSYNPASLPWKRILEIIRIVESHSAIADDELQTFAFEFREDPNLRIDDNGSYFAEQYAPFIDYICKERNRLKKFIGRPYDKDDK